MGNLKKEDNSCLRSPPLQTFAVHMKHATNHGVTGLQTRVLQKNKSCQVIISMGKRDTMRYRNGVHKLERRVSAYRTRKQKKHGVVQKRNLDLQELLSRAEQNGPGQSPSQ